MSVCHQSGLNVIQLKASCGRPSAIALARQCRLCLPAKALCAVKGLGLRKTLISCNAMQDMHTMFWMIAIEYPIQHLGHN